MDVQPGDQIVARFWQWSAERLRKDAETDHMEQVVNGYQRPDYSVSVFASPPLRPEDNVEDVRESLVAHMNTERRSKWVAFTTRRRLEESRFQVRLNEPPPQHYDVVLGTDLRDDDVVRLEAVFSEQERRRNVEVR